MSEREKEMSPKCSYYEHSPHFTPFKYSLPCAPTQLARAAAGRAAGTLPFAMGLHEGQGR